MIGKTGNTKNNLGKAFSSGLDRIGEMRPAHVVAGLILFGVGLYLTFLNILYVVEFMKGMAQPIFITIGLTALAAGIFNTPKWMQKINLAVGVVFTAVGCYGVYDEYYATMDFIRGLLPIFLIAGGLTALIHGITRIK